MGMDSDGGGVDAGAGDGVPYASAIDTSVAHPARIYDYWLGGKDNFAATARRASWLSGPTPSWPGPCSPTARS